MTKVEKGPRNLQTLKRSLFFFLFSFSQNIWQNGGHKYPEVNGWLCFQRFMIEYSKFVFVDPLKSPLQGKFASLSEFLCRSYQHTVAVDGTLCRIVLLVADSICRKNSKSCTHSRTVSNFVTRSKSSFDALAWLQKLFFCSPKRNQNQR